MTALLAWTSLVLAVVIVLVVAFHLVVIFWALKRGADHLEALAGGLGVVKQQTAPLGAKLTALNAALGASDSG